MRIDANRVGRRAGPAPPFWLRPELGRTKYVCRLFLSGHIFLGHILILVWGTGMCRPITTRVGRRRRLKFSFFPGQEKCIITTVIAVRKAGFGGNWGNLWEVASWPAFTIPYWRFLLSDAAVSNSNPGRPMVGRACAGVAGLVCSHRPADMC